jgi:hypothetical protein
MSEKKKRDWDEVVHRLTNPRRDNGYIIHVSLNPMTAAASRRALVKALEKAYQAGLEDARDE